MSAGDTLKPSTKFAFCLLPVCALVEVFPHVRFTTALVTKMFAAVFSAGQYTLRSCRYVQTHTSFDWRTV